MILVTTVTVMTVVTLVTVVPVVPVDTNKHVSKTLPPFVSAIGTILDLVGNGLVTCWALALVTSNILCLLAT